MAVVTSVRNGDASGSRTSTGLFLAVTLLSLVCYTSSLSEKRTLAEIKESHQTAKEKLEKLKNDINSEPYSGLVSEYMQILDPIITQMKTNAGDSPDFSDPLWPLVEKTKNLLEKTKTFIDNEKKGFKQQFEELEEEMKQSEKIINCLEKQQVEM